MQSVDVAQIFGEASYIGKGRFQKLEHARRMRDNQDMEETTSMDTTSMDSETRLQLHAELDQELTLKKEAINKGPSCA